MHWNNCLFWAWPKYHAEIWAWRRAGSPPDRKPAMVIRPSDSDPWWVPHFLVGPFRALSHVLSDYELVYRNAQGEFPGVPEVVSFKPTSPTNEPWYKVWLHFWFRGKPKIGDFPDTKDEPKE